MQEVTGKEQTTTYQRLLDKGFPEDSQATRIINRLYYARWRDIVLTFKGENGTWDLTRQSEYKNNWVRERSFGICQLMEIYHAPFIWKTWYKEIKPWLYRVNIKEAEAGGHTDEFLDWKTHTDYCISVRDNAISKWRIRTTFYAYKNRNSHRWLFHFVEASEKLED